MPSSNQEEWEAQTLNPTVSRFPQRKDRFVTDSGIEIDALYGPEGSAGYDFDHSRDLGYPGEYPYTRGVQPNTYRGRIWTMRQYSGYATAAETNRRFRYLLDQGQTGLSVAFDLPTQIRLRLGPRIGQGRSWQGGSAHLQPGGYGSPV